MSFPTIPLFIFTGILTFSMVFYTNTSDNLTNSAEIYVLEQSTPRPANASPFLHIDYTYDFMNVCALPVYDVFDVTIKKYMKPYNHLKNCNKKWEQLTELKNGEWRILKEGANCSARCFEENGFKGVKGHDFMAAGPVDCEFLEAACWKNGTQIYGYLHTQIVKKPIPKPTVFENQPDVFVILIDSMSYGMAKRAIPKTLKFFHETLKAVDFPYINKVGENSQPNMFPLWFGKQVEKARKMDGTDLHVDWTYNEFCKRFLDNDTHIFKDFMDYGYVTLTAEDWAKQVIDSWPFCKGFKDSPVHHSMRPFQLAYEGPATKLTKSHLDAKTSCRMRDNAVLEYFEQWMEAYKDHPKFAWLWINIPAHQGFNDLQSYDDLFFQFFQKNREMFSNSFTFLMGDHGFRIGSSGVFTTEIGQLEMNNPHLSISIPHQIRQKNPQILEQLSKNAQSLQTHYDTRATLLDILKYQPLSGYTDRRLIKLGNKEKGSSLMREQPAGPRTCGTLPIPQQYCICRTKKFNVKDPILQVLTGEKLISHINSIIQNDNLTAICEHYEFSETTALTHLGTHNTTASYKISVKVKGRSHAHFDTLLMHNPKTDSYQFEKVTRLDTYGRSTDCTKDVGFQKLCFCKDFVGEPRSTTRRMKRAVDSTWSPKFD